MNKMVVEYLQKVFSEHQQSIVTDYESAKRVVTCEQNNRLVVDISFEEIIVATKQMQYDKALGLDGLNPAFFQQFWSSLGRHVFDSCKEWLNQ